MMTELNPQVAEPRMMSPLNLAFVGDGVYELMVREHLAALGPMHVGKLHSLTVSMVCANAQSAAYETIASTLTEEEEAIYKRGRNANSTKVPKHTDPAVYRRATGMEALFGYLYLSGRTDRINQLFEKILAGAPPIGLGSAGEEE